MNVRVALLSVAVLLVSAESLPAQLFNQFDALREESSLDNAGGLSGDRRFLRQNRSRNDFVGRDGDSTDTFVGQTQGRTQGRVETAVTTLREEPQIQINTPRPAPSRTGLYEPRLTIAFASPSLPPQEENQELQEAVSQAVAMKFQGEIAVSVRDGVATLRGEVDSAEASALAALVAQFEPGVESVRNELTVNGSLSPSSPRNRP